MNLKQIDPPALYQLLGYLGAVSDFVRTGELKWYFDIKLFEYEETPAPDIRDFIGTAFPDSKPSLAEITEASVQDLAETFKHEFGRWLHPDVSQKLLTPLTELRGEVWEYMNECIDYSQSQIFEYYASERSDEFGNRGIAGSFAFVILNDTQKRCLFVAAGDCD